MSQKHRQCWFVILFLLTVVSGFSPSLIPNSKATNGGGSFVGQHLRPGIAWSRFLTNGTWESVAAADTGVYAAGVWGIDRYDFNGNRVWGRFDDSAYSVGVGSDGVYVSFFNAVRKYSFSGDPLWTLPFEYPSYAVSAVTSNSRGVYIAGDNFTSNYAFVSRLDTDGSKIWSLKFPNEIIPTSTGALRPTISVGPTQVYTIVYPSNCVYPQICESELIAMSLKGQELWRRVIPTISGLEIQVSATTDGIYVSVQPILGLGTQGTVYKYNIQGKQMWSHEIVSGAPSAISASPSGLSVLGAKECFEVQCATNSKYYFVTFMNPAGEEVWNFRFAVGICLFRVGHLHFKWRDICRRDCFAYENFIAIC